MRSRELDAPEFVELLLCDLLMAFDRETDDGTDPNEQSPAQKVLISLFVGALDESGYVPAPREAGGTVAVIRLEEFAVDIPDIYNTLVSVRVCNSTTGVYADGYGSASKSPKDKPSVFAGVKHATRRALVSGLRALWQEEGSLKKTSVLMTGFSIDTTSDEIISTVEQYLTPPGL